MQRYGITKLHMRMVALPAFIFTLFAPKLIAHFKGPHKLVILGLAISSIGLFLSAAFSAFGENGHPIWILASSIVFVSGVALSVPGLIARTASVTEQNIRGISVSFYTFVLFLGASFAPFFAAKFHTIDLEIAFFCLSALLMISAFYNSTFKEE